MPSDGVVLSDSSKLLSSEEIVRIAALFVRSGVDKIRLTGGEPTVRPDIVELTGTQVSSGVVILSLQFSIAAIGRLGSEGLKTLALTTNGLVLSKKLKDLHRNGVNALNISLDTFLPETFAKLARRPASGLSRVLASIEDAIQLGISPVKVNCVVMADINEDELVAFVAWTKERPVQVRFIELMPFDGAWRPQCIERERLLLVCCVGNAWKRSQFVPYQTMLARIRTQYPSLERLQGQSNETSKVYMPRV